VVWPQMGDAKTTIKWFGVAKPPQNDQMGVAETTFKWLRSGLVTPICRTRDEEPPRRPMGCLDFFFLLFDFSFFLFLITLYPVGRFWDARNRHSIEKGEKKN
jgi:hypothetical protein